MALSTSSVGLTSAPVTVKPPARQCGYKAYCLIIGIDNLSAVDLKRPCPMHGYVTAHATYASEYWTIRPGVGPVSKSPTLYCV
jgi:hypothetical protein